jgi:6-phosphogluconolactonase
MMRGMIEICESSAELVQRAAQSITGILKERLAEQPGATLVLSGGSTPRQIYHLLASDAFRDTVEWQRVALFWGDERTVPPTDPESNYGMTRQTMLQRLPVPESQIYRIAGELPPEQAARQYEENIRKHFGLAEENTPRFDLVLLGLGEDGHTASLFPETTALQEDRRLVASVFVRRLNTHRITMTLPVINNALRVLFLVSGAGKATILSKVLEGPGGRFPAQLIKPSGDGLHWLVDREAASSLHRGSHT